VSSKVIPIDVPLFSKKETLGLLKQCTVHEIDILSDFPQFYATYFWHLFALKSISIVSYESNLVLKLTENSGSF